MANNFRELREKMPIAHQDAASKRAKEMLAEMPLYELRKAMLLSQEALASTLNMSQPNISKLVRRMDIFVSTLRSYIKAMGGELEIIARFPDGDVRINQFDEISEPDVPSKQLENAK
jgi:transcriptional regulator with XRE-family HTH domain